jgi:DNA-binding SARP family transcriptional activator/tetratricopeptide (TPR) repeat protein
MVYIHALGKAQIDLASGHLTPASSRKFSLLLRLSADPGEPVARTTLHELIYPDLADSNARHSLRDLIYQLRQAGVGLSADPNGVRLRSDDVRSDAREVLEQSRPGLTQLRAIEGGFLPGFTPTYSEALTEWYDGYRAKTTFALCRVILQEVRRAKNAGDWSTAECAARACLALDPLNEEATLALAEMLAIGGSKVAAVELLDRYMADVGPVSMDLRLPADTLKRRIREKLPDAYTADVHPMFAGREPEMAILHETLGKARAGSPQCVVISGEPGIGKSCVAERFVTLAQLDGVNLEKMTARPSDKLAPMAAFIELVPRLLEMPGALGIDPVSMDTLALLTSRREPGTVTESPEMFEKISWQIARAISDLVDAVSTERTLVILAEDAHWMDELSLTTLVDLVSRKTTTRTMVVLTTRDATALRPMTEGTSAFTFVALGPLSGTAAGQVTQHHLPRTSDTSEVRDWVVRTSGGNPLFLRMLAAHLIATGRAFEVPRSLKELLRDRIASRSAGAHAILQAVVTLGKYCSLERLPKVLGLSHAELFVGLSELQNAHLVRLDAVGLTATHPLIEEALLNQPGDAAVKLTHRRVAEVLEGEVEAGGSPAAAWACAEHWETAGERAQALKLFRDCAQHAKQIGRPREAAEILQRASRLADDDEQRLSILRDLIRTAASCHEHELVLDATEAARRIDSDCNHDDVELCELQALTFLSRSDEEFCDRIKLCMADQAVSAQHRVRAALFLLKYSGMRARPVLVDLTDKYIRNVDLRAVTPELRLEYQLVRSTTQGDLQLAASIARSLIAFLSTCDGVPAISLTFNAAIALWMSGAYEEALEVATRASQAAERHGVIRSKGVFAMFLATLCFDLARDDDAVAWIREAEKAVDGQSAIALPLDSQMLRLAYAIVEHHGDQARKLLTPEMVAKLCGSGREIWNRTFALLIRLRGSGPVVNACELNDLLTDTDNRSSLGGIRDYEIAAGLLYFSRDPNRSRTLLVDYLENERHHRSTLGRMLSVAASEAGIFDVIEAYYARVGWNFVESARPNSQNRFICQSPSTA